MTEETFCDEPQYRKQTLSLLYETKFSALFQDLRGQTKFEASGVEYINETYFTVFDKCGSRAPFGDAQSPDPLAAGSLCVWW